MADSEDDDPDLTYSALHIHELLRCSICLDRFQNPRLLPCQHTFCEAPCLQGLIDRYHHIKCPECRAEHLVPYQGISAFPMNRTIINFLEVPRQRVQSRPPTEDNRTHQGRDAEAGAGAAVGAAAPRNVNLNELVEHSSATEAARSGCAVCGRQGAISRCSHCDSIVCDPCKRSHIDQLKLDVARIVSQLRRGIPRMSGTISSIEQKAEQLHQRAEAAKGEITETIERYIAEIRNRQRLLHSEVQMWLHGESRALRLCQENAEVELASMASFCDSTESMLARSNHNIPDEDLVDIKRQCVEHMEILRGHEEGSIRLPNERYLQFTFEGNRFSQAISNFGEISVSEDPPSSTQSHASSSREQSPGFISNGNNGSFGADLAPGAAAPPAGSHSAVTVDRALSIIGSSHAVSSPSPPPPPLPVSQRVAGMMGGGGVSEFPDLNLATPPRNRRTMPPNLSWELPVDFTAFPPRTVANGTAGSNASANAPRPPRRTLQERRRQHYSDSRIASLLGGGGSLMLSQSNPRPILSRNSRGVTTGRGLSTSLPSPRSDMDLGNNRTPPPVPPVRSRTFTRESTTGNEMQTIREEDNQSRASTADPAVRPRQPPVRFDVDFHREDDDQDDDDDNGGMVNYQLGMISGGESTTVATATNNYQDKGRAIIRFGVRGSEPTQFVWPRGVAVSNRDNNIYIADSSNHRVQVFDNIGSYVKSFGSYGDDEGEFDCLAGIAINSFGQIIISDRYNHRIQVFDHNGTFEHEFGEEGRGEGQLLYPWGVACDNMGFIYVCDKENHRIQVFQSNGFFVRKFGRLGHRMGEFENPHYIAISPDNRVFVSDSSNHRIQVFSIYGDYIFSFGTSGTIQGQMKYPKGLAIDEQGFIIVADSGNNRIQVFRGDGRFYCMFGGYGNESGQFKGLEGLAILSNGNVVVSDRENHRIQIF